MPLLRADALALFLAAAALACGGATSTQLTGPESLRCPLSMAAPSDIAASETRVTLQLQAERECAWTASTNANWVTVSPRAGQGQAALEAVVAANTTPFPRSAAIVVNDRSWTLTQQGASPAPADPPPSPGAPGEPTVSDPAAASPPEPSPEPVPPAAPGEPPPAPGAPPPASGTPGDAAPDPSVDPEPPADPSADNGGGEPVPPGQGGTPPGQGGTPPGRGRGGGE